jgi:hypothetical protein
VQNTICESNYLSLIIAPFSTVSENEVFPRPKVGRGSLVTPRPKAGYSTADNFYLNVECSSLT